METETMTKTETKTSTALTPPQDAPSWLIDSADGPHGISFDPADQLRRYVKLLQANSGEANARDASTYVAESEAGKWLFYPEQIVVDGVAGFGAFLCGLRRLHIEYLPARGGLVQVHETAPADLVEVYDETKKRPTFVRAGNRNPVEDTRELLLLADLPQGLLPYSFYATSTFIKPVCEIVTRLSLYRHPKTDKQLRSYARKVRLVSVPDSNAFGRWFKPRFIDETWASKEEYAKAQEFAALIERSNKAL
jgi:hypothetical protein